MQPQTGSQAVDRAAGLLVRVLQSPGEVSFSDLVVASELPKSTVSRLLSSLERQGLIARSPDGGVRPGPVPTRFAHSANAVDSLVTLCRPYLDELGKVTGETVNLAVPGAREVQQLAQVDSSFLLGAVNWVGREVPFHCSAQGKVFLAHGVAALPAGRLERLTDRTVTSRTALDRELRAVREQGYAVADSELEPGLVAVAAPVRSATGSVVASVSVTGPALRLTPERVSAVGRLLVQTTDRISDALAHPGGADLRAGARAASGRAGAA